MPDRPVRLPEEHEIQTLEADGVVALKGVYQDNWVETLREGVDEAMATSDRYTRRIQEAGEPDFFTDYIAWRRAPTSKSS